MEKLALIVPGARGSRQERALRDSVFLKVHVSAADGTASTTFKVRNISATGMLAEGPIGFAAGTVLLVELRNIGTIRGHVVWATDTRFGFRFDTPIDPKAARLPLK